MITLYACNFHPAFAHGTVRDIRARWALEEAGLSYEVKLVSREELGLPNYLAIHPFGKIPAISDDGQVVFESASIVLYLGQKHEVLLSKDPARRARTTSWIAAAATTLEGPVSTLGRIDFFTIDKEADQKIRPMTEQVVKARLASLAHALQDDEFLDGRFSGADIMMRSVLDMLGHTGLLSEYPVLSSYVDRCAERPAFKKAMKDHLAAYEVERG